MSIEGTPETVRAFRYWQWRTLWASMIGYALFYFVRKNLSVAMPAMQTDLGITKADLGLFLTLHGLLYGVSKFVNGWWGDRANARVFMVTGLVLSAVANVFFGFSSTVVVLGIIWMINGWVQGMGYPPCARLMTHWFPPQQLATKMSIWNTSHSVGAGLVVVFCGYVVAMGWRWCFWLPALVAIVGSVGLWYFLRDTPASVGLPDLPSTEIADHGEDDKASAEFKDFVRKRVFGNPAIWLISFANFFVYTVRYAVLDWGPTLLHESKGLAIHRAGWMVAAFEVAGVVGMLVAGWATDRFFGGRAPRTCVFCMLFAGIFLFLFWRWEQPPVWLATVLLAASGFFVYGPQALIGIAAANMATKRAAGTAGGLTGIFGYASTLLSGWGLGYTAQNYGWDYAFAALMVICALGMLMFILAWPAKAHGYRE